jgi:hypothetical protein
MKRFIAFIASALLCACLFTLSPVDSNLPNSNIGPVTTSDKTDLVTEPTTDDSIPDLVSTDIASPIIIDSFQDNQ